MKEATVIGALLQDREAYDAISPYHEAKDLSDMGEIIYKEIQKYYSKDPEAIHVDTTSLLLRLKRLFPKPAQYLKFEKFITELPEVSVGNILEDYRAVKLDSIGELAGAFLVAGDHKKADELLRTYRTLYDDGLEAESGEEEAVVCIGALVSEFADSLTVGNRIPIAPACLNALLGGGLIPGSHTLVFAPPECGKTATAITMAFAGCYKGKRVMYVGNEEAKDMYQMRIMSRFSGMEEHEIHADHDLAYERAVKNGYNNLIFIHLSPGSTDKVKKLALEHKADVVVLDQLHNLALKDGKGKQPEKTIMLEKLAYEMRMFYSKHKIAGLSFTQADEKAIGKLFLEMKNVYYSNIGVQGQVDAMIGIGMDDAHKSMNRRVFNVVKNKLSGIHDHKTVTIFPKLSAIRGV
ncbi:MAG: ATPase domain-containing protein [Dehalococcoidales bacterium]